MEHISNQFFKCDALLYETLRERRRLRVRPAAGGAIANKNLMVNIWTQVRCT